jgi:hypothetical protein
VNGAREIRIPAGCGWERRSRRGVEHQQRHGPSLHRERQHERLIPEVATQHLPEWVPNREPTVKRDRLGHDSLPYAVRLNMKSAAYETIIPSLDGGTPDDDFRQTK